MPVAAKVTISGSDSNHSHQRSGSQISDNGFTEIIGGKKQQQSLQEGVPRRRIVHQCQLHYQLPKSICLVWLWLAVVSLLTVSQTSRLFLFFSCFLVFLSLCISVNFSKNFLALQLHWHSPYALRAGLPDVSIGLPYC